MQLELGNRSITLKAFPESHSHNDLIVIDNKTETLWSGDLIFRERIPSLTGSLRGWIDSMKTLHSLKVNKVIPGHGSIANSINEALSQQEDYLTLMKPEKRLPMGNLLMTPWLLLIKTTSQIFFYLNINTRQMFPEHSPNWNGNKIDL